MRAAGTATLFLLGLAVVLAPAGPARGWACLRTSAGACQHWPEQRATLRSLLGPAGTTLINGTITWDQNAIAAANDWNSIGSNFRFSVQTGGDRPPLCLCPNPGAAGITPVLFTESSCSGSGFGDIVAETVNCFAIGSGAIESSAVFVNAAIAWNAYDGALRLPVYDLRRVLLHEFGHVLGLAHPDDAGQEVVAIMNSRVSRIDRLQADDINGAFSLYPTGPRPSSASNTSCRLRPPAAGGGQGGATAAALLAPLALLGGLRRRASGRGPAAGADRP